MKKAPLMRGLVLGMSVKSPSLVANSRPFQGDVMQVVGRHLSEKVFEALFNFHTELLQSVVVSSTAAGGATSPRIIAA